MRIAICDDEQGLHGLLKENLEKYAKKRGVIFLYDDFLSGAELVRACSGGGSYDLIFMDYQMSGLNGIETAKKLREKNDKTIIIFLTSFPQVVFESFEVNAFRFLVKPVDYEKLCSALDGYMTSREEALYLVLSDKSSSLRLDVNDIIYIEADNRSSIIRLTDRTVIHPTMLAEIQRQLPPDRFLRCHKSFIVGFRHISSHKGSCIFFDNGERAAASKSNTAEFKRKYLEYLKRYTFEVKQ